MMKLYFSLAALLVVLTITVNAQPVCDFTALDSTANMSWTDNNASPYTTWSAGSNNWEIINTSTIGSPSGSPYVLHTNPGRGNGSQSPQWLTSQPITNFNWQYNQLQWSFWFGRRANNGKNGGNVDVSTVWLFVNSQTGLDAVNTPGLEGLKVSWHHDGNTDGIRLSEVRNGSEYILGDVVLLDNLSNYQWGTTVMVKRIPGGIPTGAEVKYEVWLSTPVTTDTAFANSSLGADADPIAASTYLRIDTTVLNAWAPSSTTGRLGVMSYFTGARKEAAEYNQLCFQDFGPTPVELSSFTAEYRNDLVDLNWQTATELNNFGFEVQRAIENDGNWETIAFVDGHGTTNSPHEYGYTDAPNADGAGTIAYRLKQIDRDGAHEYSNTVLVSIAPQSADVLYNFPNPFNPATTINFNLLTGGVVTLNVYNAAGEKVAELYDEASMSAGYHSASFNGSNLPSGTYFYRLTTSAGTKTNSMVLSK